MKRIWIHLGVAFGTAIVGGAIVSACAHNNASIFISQVFAPTIPTNGACSYTADPTQTLISAGTVDLSYASLSTYTPEVLVGNQIVSQGNANMEQAETSRVLINGAITRITDLAGDTSILTLLSTMCAGGKGDPAACATGKKLVAGTLQTPVNPFSTVEATVIQPASAATAQYAALALTMVDGATVAVLRDYFQNALQLNGAAAFTTTIELITYTKVEGVTLGNDTEESNEFEFPVTFTYGSLVDNLAEDPQSAVGYCLVAETLPTTAQTCTYGQDAPAIVGAIPGVPACPKAGDASIISTIDAGGGD